MQRTRQKLCEASPLWLSSIFFGTMELHRKIFNVSKGPPSIFIDILQKERCKKSQMVPTYIIRHYETVINTIPSTKWKLYRKKSHSVFPTTIQKTYQFQDQRTFRKSQGTEKRKIRGSLGIFYCPVCCRKSKYLKRQRRKTAKPPVL